MRKAKIIIILILVAVGAIIVLQNTAEVETRILWMSFTMPRAILLFVTAVVGFAVGLLVALMARGKG